MSSGLPTQKAGLKMQTVKRLITVTPADERPAIPPRRGTLLSSDVFLADPDPSELSLPCGVNVHPYVT